MAVGGGSLRREGSVAMVAATAFRRGRRGRGRISLRLLALVAFALLAAGASGAAAVVSAPAERWVIRDLGSGQALDVNERGQVLGWAGSRGFVWLNGRRWNLPERGDPYALNERGQVLLKHPSAGGDYHAFLWQSGRLTDLGTLGGPRSYPTFLNDVGQVLGQADTGAGAVHRFLWENGVMTDIEGWSCRPRTINNRGAFAGVTATPSSDPHACVLDRGTLADLGTLGGKTSEATRINDTGQVVGAGDTAAGARHSFLWEEGAMTDLGPLPVVAWNSRRQVVLNRGASPRLGHAFLWRNGKLTDLGTLGGKDAAALDINERGQIVGYSGLPGSTAGGPRHAFVWQNGKMTDLGTLPGGSKSRAVAINDRGQIVGFAATRAGAIHAVLWSLRSG